MAGSKYTNDGYTRATRVQLKLNNLPAFGLVVMTAWAVYVSMGDLFLCRSTYIHDIHNKLQSDTSERMVAIHNHIFIIY